MSIPRVLGCAMAVAVVCLLIASPFAAAVDEKAGPVGEFQGKIVTIAFGPPESSALLEKVAVRNLGGRAFLVGTGVNMPGNWQNGLVVWVPVEDVSQIVAYSTLDELKKVYTEFQRLPPGAPKGTP